MRVDYLLKCSAKIAHKRLLLFQLTITSSQMQWTSDCTKALASTKERGDKKALKSLKKKQVLKTNSRVTTPTVVCSFNFSSILCRGLLRIWVSGPLLEELCLCISADAFVQLCFVCAIPTALSQLQFLICVMKCSFKR